MTKLSDYVDSVVSGDAEAVEFVRPEPHEREEEFSSSVSEDDSESAEGNVPRPGESADSLPPQAPEEGAEQPVVEDDGIWQ